MDDMLVRLGAVLLVASALGCSTEPSARELVERTVAWMGGADRLHAVRSLTAHGDGIIYLLGQSHRPFDDPAAWSVSAWRRTFAIAAPRLRVTREIAAPAFWPLPPEPPRQYGLTPDDTPPAVPYAHLEWLHHPVVLLRAALDGGRLRNARIEDGYRLVDLTTAAGDEVTLGFDPAFAILTVARSATSHPFIGDAVFETFFSQYEPDPSTGVRLPLRIRSRLDVHKLDDFRISGYASDDAVLAGAEAGSKLPARPATTPVEVSVLAPGVWRLAGSSHHSVLVERSDHLLLFEVPLDDTRTRAVIDAARRLRPGKPLTHAVVSHHHWDHAGGVRAAAAAGLTLIVHRSNQPLLQDVIRRPHTRDADAPARQPGSASFVAVDLKLNLEDRVNPIDIMTVASPHTPGMLVAYLRRSRLLLHADLASAGGAPSPYAGLLADLTMRERMVRPRHVPVHGEPFGPEVLEQSVGDASIAR